MRTFTLLFSALVIGTSAQAQGVATFEDLTLVGTDTAYINYTPATSGTDVGFNDGHAHFPCIYDTSYGGVWSTGFAYSNWTDSVTSGPGNQYSAKTAIGYAGSAQYAVAWVSNPLTFANNINLTLTDSAAGKPVSGFYVTNNTYAYNSMFYGDAATGGGPGKKFGGTTGNDPDWFLLTIKGYNGATLTADSVNFYLADFRFASNDSDYIVKTWEWVNLLPLGHVDSLQFSLSSSDTGMYGMNTPSYFCMDNFVTNENTTAVSHVAASSIAKVYPNPATNMLYVDISDNTVQQVTISDMAGSLVSVYNAASHLEINTSSLPVGTYLLQLTGNGKNAATRFVKK